MLFQSSISRPFGSISIPLKSFHGLTESIPIYFLKSSELKLENPLDINLGWPTQEADDFERLATCELHLCCQCPTEVSL